MRSFRTSRLTRRTWLRLAAGATSGLAALMWGDAAARPVAAVSPLTTSQAAAITAPPSTVSRAQSAGTLRTADPFGAPSLDPINAVTSYIIMYGMGEALVRITPHGTVEPWLAESVTPVDSLRWRVRLKDGISFWNGRPLDAEAVQSATLRIVEKRKATAALLDLASVEIVDDLTLDLVTRAPNGAFQSSLGGFNLIVHDADAAARMGDEAFGSAPVLTGPMTPPSSARANSSPLAATTATGRACQGWTDSPPAQSPTAMPGSQPSWRAMST